MYTITSSFHKKVAYFFTPSMFDTRNSLKQYAYLKFHLFFNALIPIRLSVMQGYRKYKTRQMEAFLYVKSAKFIIPSKKYIKLTFILLLLVLDKK